MPHTECFQPSRHGFVFVNEWPAQPAVVLSTPFGEVKLGNAGSGLCGGMVFAALDYWGTNTAPPPARPALGEPLYHYIVRRLIESWRLPVGVVQYFQWMNLPDSDFAFHVFGRRVVTERGLAWRTIEVQWPQIRSDLDGGIPVPLGVVTVSSTSPADLGVNHQVLAVGYRAAGRKIVMRVYDPNQGQRDDVYIQFDTGAPTKATAFAHNLGIARTVRGFFRAAYTPATPPPA
jgi:hypothetical protein